MILVVGATGLLGSEIVRRLCVHGHAVRALWRPASGRADALAALGVERTAGDLKEPATLHAACAGCDTVISTATAAGRRGGRDSLRTVDRDGQLALVEAARAAGVRRFVFVSVSPSLRPTSSLVRYKRLVEAAVRASGMEWVILQPAAFMEVWLSPLLGWDFARAKALIVGTGTTRASLVSALDVAAFAVAAAEQPDLRNREIPVGGPDAVSANEILALAQGVTGKVFHARRVPTLLPRALSRLLRPIAPLPASLMDLAAQAALHDDVLDVRETARALEISLTSLRDFAIRAAGGGASGQETSEA